MEKAVGATALHNWSFESRQQSTAENMLHFASFPSLLFKRKYNCKNKKEGDITLHHIANTSVWCRVISPVLFLQF